MTNKQRVTFRFSDPGSEPTGTPPNLAVEVHDASFALAGWGTLDGGVELEPGQEYFISATLADGSRVSTHTKLDPNATEVMLHQPTAGSRNRTADEAALTESVLSDAEGVAMSAAPAAAADPPWRVTGFCGNLLKGKPTTFALDQIELTAAAAKADSTAGVNWWLRGRSSSSKRGRPTFGWSNQGSQCGTMRCRSARQGIA